MSELSDDKIMGFIPKSKYVMITYYLLIASCVGSLVLSLLAIIGLVIPLGNLFALAGLIGLVLALLGYFIFKSDFSAHDQAHLLYICIIAGIFILVGAILGASLVLVPTAAFMITFLIAGAQAILIYTGYNSWKNNRTITKDNIESEIRLALKRG